MSNKLEEILTNPDSTENFKDKFLGLILGQDRTKEE